MSKIKSVFTNMRVIIALICLVLAVVAIYPNFGAEGVAIRSVTQNSSASIAGFENPKPTSTPMSKEIIHSINNLPVKDSADYYNIVSSLKPNRTVHIQTNKKVYQLLTQEKFDTITLPETEEKKITETILDEKTNISKNITRTITVNKTEQISKGLKDIGLSIFDAPQTNLRKGLDLQGGTRVLLQPEEVLEKDQMATLVDNMKYRLNVYGLSDIIVREASDLSGNQYITVEIAGAKEEDVKELLSKQGKFEAKIGNNSVFKGGQDITYVCRSAECSGIDAREGGCSQISAGQWMCRFSFAISLSPEAAAKQAELTKDLAVVNEDGGDYLSEKLILYLDDAQVDELNIGADLKGRAVTDIAISGSGAGRSGEEAGYNALDNMKRLQTILITGSLPVKLTVVKTDVISADFGKAYVDNALFIGMLALLGVSVLVLIRYRQWKIILPMVLTAALEVVLLLGVAAVIGWNLDLAAIAAIILVIGTSLDHQIVITDNVLSGRKEEADIMDWKSKLKYAFFIIIAAYFTTSSAMIPLWFAGAGLLKGFALTTIIGLTMGVFVARPAYAAAIEILLKK